MNEKDKMKYEAEKFAEEYRALVKKYYGDMEPRDYEPFGMRLRELLPISDLSIGSQITTTKTISIPWDTDPADHDEPLSFTSMG